LMSELNAAHQAKRAARQAELEASYAKPQLCIADSNGSPRQAATDTASAARVAHASRSNTKL